MLGRVIRRRPESARITRPDLLGESRYELVATAPRDGSRRPQTARPLLSRPDWNDDTSPRYSAINDPPPLFGGPVRPRTPRQPLMKGPGSPRGRPKTAGAVVPNHPLMNGISADGETPRPVSSPGFERGEGPRTRRMREANQGAPVSAPPVKIEEL